MKTQNAINDFLHSRLAQDLSQETITWYQAKLNRFAKIYPKLPNKPRAIEAFLAGLNCSPSTKENYFNALKTFYRFLRKRHHRTNPMEQVTPPRPRKRKVMATLEPDEEMRLLNSASNLRDRAILMLLIDSGIRSSELTGLRQQDINSETVRVYGKSGEREVPISEESRRLLLSVIASDSKEDDYVFRGHKGPLTRKGIYTIVSTYMRKAGIQGPKLGSHRIRHAFGKGYLVNGGDLRSLQQLMGHERITTTQEYANLATHNLIAKHHQFTPLRSVQAAVQQSFFDKKQAIKEAEEIVAKRRADKDGH